MSGRRVITQTPEDRIVSGLLCTSVADTEATLRCDETNGCRIPVDLIRSAIEIESSNNNTRRSMVRVLKAAVRRRLTMQALAQKHGSRSSAARKGGAA